MTVSELLKRLASAYPSFDAKAGETWAPVFRARLGKHEGDRLDAAAIEVLGAFKPTTRQPFPIPADFEQHLPNGKLNLSEDPGIRQHLEDRSNRRRQALDVWARGQGAKIRAARPEQVYMACLLLALDQCGRQDWCYLSVQQIRLCEHRAVSQERLRRHGPPPKDGAVWWQQISEIAAEWGAATTYEDWVAKKPERAEAA